VLKDALKGTHLNVINITIYTLSRVTYTSAFKQYDRQTDGPSA